MQPGERADAEFERLGLSDADTLECLQESDYPHQQTKVVVRHLRRDDGTRSFHSMGTGEQGWGLCHGSDLWLDHYVFLAVRKKAEEA